MDEHRGKETGAAWEQLLRDLREDEWPELTVTGKLLHETEVIERHKDFGKRIVAGRAPTPDYAMCTPDIVVSWKDKAGHTKTSSQKRTTQETPDMAP